MPRARSHRASQKPSAGFKSNHHAVDVVAGFVGLIAPAIQQLQQRILVGHQFLQRIAIQIPPTN
jgi:hypothetical protein